MFEWNIHISMYRIYKGTLLGSQETTSEGARTKEEFFCSWKHKLVCVSKLFKTKVSLPFPVEIFSLNVVKVMEKILWVHAVIGVHSKIIFQEYDTAFSTCTSAQTKTFQPYRGVYGIRYLTISGWCYGNWGNFCLVFSILTRVWDENL